ncbi:MAG: isopentenyl transferase family protein, partial [Cyanobacteriota bacterium]|nr:isopentenyl transferase family protein [Cyanobacteriota bacterium]
MVTLITICGPTATGKSGLALKLAERLGVGIISADSRQVYRDFNIGTAKPTEAELRLVPHYLIDICDPTETLTLAEYQLQARSLIEKQDDAPPPPPPPPPVSSPPFSRGVGGDLSLLVGGTGLYIKAIVRGLKIPRVAPQEELRARLVSLGKTQCYQMLQQV